MTTPSSPPYLLDVRQASDFATTSLPEAVNNCIYQMGFVERMPETWPKDAEIHIAGYTEGGREVRMAIEKLERADYTRVSAWSGPHSEPPTGPVPTVIKGAYSIDTAASRIGWTGKNHFSTHTGTLGFSSGELSFEEGRWTGGSLTIDFDTLACTDLAGTPMHEVLITHLKDHDFFDTEAHPAPTVRIDQVKPMDAAVEGQSNVEVTATLTLKGVAKPVTFRMATGRADDGRFGAQGHLVFDRTEWGVLYGSGKLFHRLGMHLVHDEISLEVTLVAPTAG